MRRPGFCSGPGYLPIDAGTDGSTDVDTIRCLGTCSPTIPLIWFGGSSCVCDISSSCLPVCRFSLSLVAILGGPKTLKSKSYALVETVTHRLRTVSPRAILPIRRLASSTPARLDAQAYVRRKRRRIGLVPSSWPPAQPSACPTVRKARERPSGPWPTRSSGPSSAPHARVMSPLARARSPPRGVHTPPFVKVLLPQRAHRLMPRKTGMGLVRMPIRYRKVSSAAACLVSAPSPWPRP